MYTARLCTVFLNHPEGKILGGSMIGYSVGFRIGNGENGQNGVKEEVEKLYPTEVIISIISTRIRILSLEYL